MLPNVYVQKFEWTIKAAMIATGGLSGGISSTIAGGNFWDGFRQGIITSGLNHVAHLAASSIQENNLIRKSFDDPDGVPEQNMESVKTAYNKVKHLFTKAMINVLKAVPIGNVHIDLTVDNDFAAETKWSTGTTFSTSSINGKYTSVIIKGQIVVTLFKSSFSDWATLGRNILHEYYHASDMASNLYKTTYVNTLNKYGNNKRAMSHFTDWSESRAYNFIYKLGDTWSVYENFKHLYHKQ